MTGSCRNMFNFQTLCRLILTCPFNRYSLAASDAYFPGRKRRRYIWILLLALSAISAASRGIFVEGALSITYGHDLLTASVMVILAVDSSLRISSHYLNLHEVTSEEEKAYISASCGDGLSLCRVGWELSYFMPWCAGILIVTMLLSVMFTPVRCWSPVFQETRCIVVSVRLRRFLRYMIPFSLVSFVWTCQTVFASMFWIGGHIASKSFLEVYVFTSTANFIFEVFVLLWCNGWFAGCASTVTPSRQPAQGMAWADEDDTHIIDMRHGSWSDGTAHLHRSIVPHAHAGKWHWRDMFATMCILFLGNAELSTGIQFGGIAGTWAMRLVLLALALFFPDKTASFDDLERESTGFGLVADAPQLRAAVLAAVRGAPLDKPLRTYKASMLRMKQTLAVSYRWQPEAVPIAPGHTLNMSAWQMKAVADTIREHRVAYVWVDVLSVPQTGHHVLKMTLLSRMMAVYASAGKTLALRSVEADGSRCGGLWTAPAEVRRSFSPRGADNRRGPESLLTPQCERKAKDVGPAETHMCIMWGMGGSVRGTVAKRGFQGEDSALYGVVDG
uniref:Heterokaryon incompatibility domain-containing protein n=1 Tax=Tetraselmis sp. GSL018 TaxID=582737 RepID=A0A061SHF3_9CHLO